MLALNQLLSLFAFGPGSSDMPFAIVPASDRPAFGKAVTNVYPHMDTKFTAWLKQTDAPLVVVPIAGFKPRGDDSRPDRGLLSLVRMLFGEDVDVLSIVYGPAKASAWQRFATDPMSLAQVNGLWNAILTLSNAIIADSMTTQKPMALCLTRPEPPEELVEVSIPAASSTPAFGEHDVDTAIRFLYHGDDTVSFEGMCNPPGGDWSGVSLLSKDRETEYRWTSLPRVSHHGGKRPDHVVQYLNAESPDEILSIESKRRCQDFEANVGDNLNEYTMELIRHPATVAQPFHSKGWAHNNVAFHSDCVFVSAGAYIGNGTTSEAVDVARKYHFNIVVSVQFSGEKTQMLIAYNNAGAHIAQRMAKQSSVFQRWLKIDMHAF
jgi:hypothetical protein